MLIHCWVRNGSLQPFSSKLRTWAFAMWYTTHKEARSMSEKDCSHQVARTHPQYRSHWALWHHQKRDCPTDLPTSMDVACYPHGWFTDPEADLLWTATEWLPHPGGQLKRYKDNLKIILKQCGIPSSDTESLAMDRTTWRTTCSDAVSRWGEAPPVTEEACTALGRPVSQQRLPMWHVRPDVPVKDRTLRLYQNRIFVGQVLQWSRWLVCVIKS